MGKHSITEDGFLDEPESQTLTVIRVAGNGFKYVNYTAMNDDNSEDRMASMREIYKTSGCDVTVSLHRYAEIPF